MTDPFGTAAIRRAALAAWRDSPTRFREDANAEEDVARSDYHDRALVEIAQNAADAATDAGVEGRLRLEVVGDRVYAANTGTPLSAQGVLALTHLRASTKSSGAVGRFGVGFKAVLAWSDAPEIHTTAGAVRWSSAQTRREVDAIASLREQSARRAGHVPVMRLPWPAEPDAHAAELLAQGYATVVVLPVRGGVDVAGDLDRVDALLLLSLPHLATVELPNRTISARRTGRTVRIEDGSASTSWWLADATGDVPSELLEARPIEERARASWSVVWAFPQEPSDAPFVLRAPQPTDERLSVPAVLVASVPLDTSRRHVVAGPLTDFVLGQAADRYSAALAERPRDPAVLDLVPTGFPASPTDAVLRARLDDALRRSSFLPTADGGHCRPEDATVLDLGPADEAVAELLAPMAPQLLDPGCASRHGALAALGVRRLSTADVVDTLVALDQPPEWWARLYAALAGAPDRDALRALPVPTADGRLARDPRRLSLAAGEVDTGLLGAAGVDLTWVHPAAATGAARDVLLAAGVRAVDRGALLDALREAVQRSLDDDPPADPTAVTDAVLSLVSADPSLAVDRDWLASVALPDVDGELRAAEELLLPAEHGGRLAALVAADAPFGVLAESVVTRWGAQVLAAVGVLTTFSLLRDEDVAAEPGAAEHWLDGEPDWLGELADGADGAPVVISELVAVRDLEWVRSDAWALALDELGSTAELRAALADLVVAGRRVPSYTAWWLGRHRCVPARDGTPRRPVELCTAGAGPDLAAVLDLAAPLSPAAQHVATIAGLVADDELDERRAVAVLAGLADPGRAVSPGQAKRLHRAALPLAPGLDLTGVRVLRGPLTAVVAPDEAVAVDAPWQLPLLDGAPILACPVALADLAVDVLDVRSARAELDVRITGGVSREWTELGDWTSLLDALGGRPAPWVVVHDRLEVQALGGVTVAVPWVELDGVAHLAGDAAEADVAAALAWAVGLWPERERLLAWRSADAATRDRMLGEAAL